MFKKISKYFSILDVLINYLTIDIFQLMLSKFFGKSSSLTCQYLQRFATTRFDKSVTAEVLLDDNPKTMKRTKMINTIGPKTMNPESAGKLIDEGMNVARLNFSHGDHAQHLQQAQAVWDALKTRPGAYASILLDTKGPEIRTGNNQGGKPIQLKKGQLLELTSDYTHLGTSKRIAVSYSDLATSTKVGRKILIADGGVSTLVKKIEQGIVTVEVLNDGKFGSKKNMCLPGTPITLPTIGKEDEYDIVQFGVKHKVDYIAVSFARRKKDLDDLRRFIIDKDPIHGPNIHLISKIENHQSIHNLQEIIKASDGIMVARGDLGMQVPIEKVVILQKYIMDNATANGKYVITATQMLESMEVKPRPTRAEVSDITNAVMDLTDAVMTSGETTNGLFPIECAQVMSSICKETESVCDYKRIFKYRRQVINDPQAVGIVSFSFELDCDFIFLQTDCMKLINRISLLRPKAYICVFTDDPKIKKITTLNFGIYVFPRSQHRSTSFFIHNNHFGFEKAKALHIETDSLGKISKFWYDIN